MSARTLAPVATRIGPRPPLPEPNGAAGSAAPTPSTTPIAVRLTGASMRLLEVSLAAAAIATALLAGVGR